MWEPAMDTRRYRWRYRWSVAWEGERGRGGQAELSWGEDRRCGRVGRAHEQQTAAPPFVVGCDLRKLE